MATVNIYLTFKGDCEEAFNLYKSVFGGEFPYIGRYKDMPQDGGTCPPEDLEKVMHISLPISKETVLMGADGMDAPGRPPFTVGNNFSISVNTSSQGEADSIFNGLAAGGLVTMPLNKTFWGAYFGMLTDKFGINWMVGYEEPQPQIS
jgi:PhnB protein